MFDWMLVLVFIAVLHYTAVFYFKVAVTLVKRAKEMMSK